ncbi:EAL domain-containing response regulator [Cobetia sp. 14N.309.X.WAT.E.A4]|uniref:EAL domain-containing response regulator n=1 Tax=Cobetia sp. 14N.309.X.WAT.E.A4 TaxID=2998323 RepID=UPI0025B0F185|nr:EAL domain-containing response regulator [Cobetia sp. 14N.309.X.WAT.E.A4]MDN2657502.1 EAL domain-containing response regulator [Cobetia sp. 14N.309.X.WAT.E.A4]
MTRHALIIDDDPDFRELIAGLLSTFGFSCMESEGLQDIACDPSSLQADLILVDYELGDFTGADVLSYLRERNVEAGIILMSACHDDDMQAMINQGRRSGLDMLGQLNKPFDLKHLASMLNDLDEHHNPLTLAELDEALAQQQLHLVYQPKIDLASGQLSGAEALVRWQHPLRGMVMPNQFIALAERSNRIESLTWQVINQGFGQQQEWQSQGLTLNLALNLSPQLLRSRDMLKKLDALASQHQVDPHTITLELTESCGIDCLTYARHLLNAIRERGYRLALDDFGTGFSSMMQLYNLPFDELKIDQCFVGRSDSHPEARAITRTIVELGQRLNLAVVGEGIETTQQRDYLCDTRCNLGQGYLFARPMTVTDFNAWSHCPPTAVSALIQRHAPSVH